MKHQLTGLEIAWAAQMACLYEAAVHKPGNVSPSASFRDARFEDFAASAVAIGTAFQAADDVSVGEIIERAQASTSRLVATNTNLGIILLLAPLARAAACAEGGEGLRASLSRVLRGLTVEDARHAYRAIRGASPGGIGEAPDHDVADAEVTVTLLEAMAAARKRDAVAREYTTDFEITFALGAETLRKVWEDGGTLSEAVVTAFLTILARVPDTLIARKNGLSVADDVSRRAAWALEGGAPGSEEWRRRAATLDAELRDDAHSLNPGTTADLCTATLFVFLTEDGMLSRLPEVTARW